MIEIVTGCVARIVHVSPTGGAIFRLLLKGSAKSVRVIASRRVMSTSPILGEELILSGRYVNHRTFGIQFDVSAATRVLPSRDNIIRFLRSHPRFAWVGPRFARELLNRLGNDLAKKIMAGDYMAIAAASGMEPSDAMRLIREWREYALNVQVSNEFASRGLSLVFVKKALSLWGDAAGAVVAVNPYILVAIASWAEIDKVCTTELSICADDPRRLVAACVSCVDQYLTRHRVVKMGLQQLSTHLQIRLGCESLASCSVEIATSQGLLQIHEAAGRKTVQTVGQGILERAILRAVRHSITAPLTADANQGDVPRPTGGELTCRGPGYRILHICCFDSLKLARFASQETLHIFPSESMRQLFCPYTDKTMLYVDVNKKDWGKKDLLPVFYIYGADMLDLTKATKLVYDLPLGCDVCIISPNNIERRVDSFWNFLHSSICCSRNNSADHYISCTGEEIGADSNLSTSPENQLAPRLADAGQVDNGSPKCRNAVRVRRIDAASWGEVIALTLEAFREAADSDSALILTMLKKDAIRLNRVLHEEHLELRLALDRPTPGVRIYNGLMATIDEKIVARMDINSKSIFTGAVGTIRHIEPLPLGQGTAFIEPNMIVATAIFDTVGLVDLTAEDCSSLDFGYAVSADLDRWGSVSHRIFVTREQVGCPSTCLASQFMRTGKLFTIISEAPQIQRMC